MKVLLARTPGSSAIVSSYIYQKLELNIKNSLHFYMESAARFFPNLLLFFMF